MAGIILVMQPSDHPLVQEHRPVLTLLEYVRVQPASDHAVFPTPVAGGFALRCYKPVLCLDLLAIVDLDDLERLKGAPVPPNNAELARRPIDLELLHGTRGVPGNAG